MLRKLFEDRISINRIVFVLSILGAVIAIYVLQSFIRQSPIVCVNTGCEIVRKSPLSYIFGIPVPAFGLIGYSFLAILAYIRTMTENKRLLLAMLGISFSGVVFVSWFTYTEIFLINGICSWCAVSAVNMIVIFILVGQSYRLKF